MDFGRQRGFLLDGEDPFEKVGCTKESYFLEFMYVDVARDFAITIIIIIIITTTTIIIIIIIIIIIKCTIPSLHLFFVTDSSRKNVASHFHFFQVC